MAIETEGTALKTAPIDIEDHPLRNPDCERFLYWWATSFQWANLSYLAQRFSGNWGSLQQSNSFHERTAVVSTKRKQKATRPLVDPRLAKAIAHPMRVEILVELQKAPMSPTEYVNQFGGGLANVAYHFRELAKMNCLVIADTQPRRGATEHFYEVAKRALFNEHDFAALPVPLRGGFDASIFSTFMQQGQQALEADTIDSQDNKHLTWQTLRLDKEGFDNLMDRLMDVFKQASVEQLASEARLEKSEETPLYTTLGMFGFESPAPERNHDLGED